MRKMMKMALLLCLAVLLVVLNGCSKEPVSIIGVWTLTDMTGSEAAVQDMQANEAAGVKVTMAISRDEIEMVATCNGGTEYDHETTLYRIEGDQLITGVAQMTYSLTETTLTLTRDGVTMVYTRK